MSKLLKYQRDQLPVIGDDLVRLAASGDPPTFEVLNC